MTHIAVVFSALSFPEDSARVYAQGARALPALRLGPLAPAIDERRLFAKVRAAAVPRKAHQLCRRNAAIVTHLLLLGTIFGWLVG